MSDTQSRTMTSFASTAFSSQIRRNSLRQNPVSRNPCSMVFAQRCFGQPRKKRGEKLSIGRATQVANLELTRLPEKNSSVTWTARKRAGSFEKERKIEILSSAAKRNNHMQDASHQSKPPPTGKSCPRNKRSHILRASHGSSSIKTLTRMDLREGHLHY